MADADANERLQQNPGPENWPAIRQRLGRALG